jgi:NTE family protein
MKPIHVALSGSGFKFPAHVGALFAIRDNGYDIKELAGTSGGSIVATLLASGMSLDDMKTLTMTRDWSDMLTFSVIQSIEGHGYCSGNTLHEWIEQQTESQTFADLPFNLIIMASDVTNETTYEFSKTLTPDTKIAFAARSSASIPFVYAPTSVGSITLMDGGMANNIPVDRLTVEPDVLRLGIQLVATDPPLPPNTPVLMDVDHIVNLMLASNESTHVQLGQLEGAHVVFTETGFANSLDRNMTTEIRQRLFDSGYQSTDKLLKSL